MAWALLAAALLAGAPDEDRVSYLDNGAIRLGVNLGLGGAITYLAPSGDHPNVINSADWGRQIQLSFYSGPTPFAPGGKQPLPAWAGLGWNPIQSGDCYGHRSKVLEHTNDGKTLYTKCIPMQWPLSNEPGECTFETWITLEGKTASVRARLTNHRADHTFFGAREQELPAIYTNGPWWRLMTYEGDKPFTGDGLTQAPPKFMWTAWSATENWAALVDDHDFGVGVWQPGVYRMIGGFAGKPGHGGPKDGPTGYIAPLYQEHLDWNIVYDYGFTLIVDDLKGIRQYVYDHAAKPAPLTWRFAHDRQHWQYVNCADTGSPIDGELKLVMDRDDPQMHSAELFLAAADNPKVYVEAAYDGPGGTAEVFWARRDAPGFSGQRVARFEPVADGRYHVYEVDLSRSPEWRGIITQLRFDPVPDGRTGGKVRLRSIGFAKPAA